MHSAPGDSIFHSELLAIIDAMHKHLKIMSLCNHAIAPVSVYLSLKKMADGRSLQAFLFSVMPTNHIRVIEVFYDGLVACSTKNYGIRHRDLDLYLYVTMVVGISESEGHRGIRSSSTGRDFSLQ